MQDEVLLKNCRHCEVWKDVEGGNGCDQWIVGRGSANG